MQAKPNYQELERKIKLLEDIEKNNKLKIEKLKDQVKKLKTKTNEPQKARNIFLKGKIVILKIQNKPGWPIEYASQNIEKLFDYSLEEITISKISFEDIIHPQSISFFEQKINSINTLEKSEDPERIEFQIITKKSNDKWIDSQIIAIKDSKGKTTHFQLVLSDISEKKQLEFTLKQNEERYRLLFENSPLGVYIADKEGNILEANPTLIKIIGSPSIEETKKINILKFNPLIEIGYAQEFKQCIGTGEIIKNEMRYTSKWGKTICLKGHLVPIKNVKNEVERVFTIMEDITKQKEDEKTLRNSEKKLKKANDTKDTFFSIIAHDLRSPFNTMLGFIQLLNQTFDQIDQSKHKEYLNLIEQSAKNTYDLLEDLLLWSNTQSGKIEFEPVLLDLYTHIDNSLELLINTAKEKNISINQNVSKDIFLYADKEMLSVVVRNLISNAIKFTPKGGEINIYTKINRDNPADQFVDVIVEDNGQGIHTDILEKLFKIDQNISTKGTENERGTGLGLVLCKEFIEKHDGTIQIESELGKGSKFIFTLPIN